MKIDRDEFTKTASVILVVNEHAKERFTIESLTNFMIGMAHKTIDGEGATFCGTMGFYLTGFRDYDNELQVRATLAPWIVDEYLQSQRKKLKEVLDILA